LKKNSWYRLGILGIEKRDPYNALMGFEGAVVREMGDLESALQLLQKSAGLLLQNSWLHEAKSLVDSFAKSVRKQGDSELASEGLFAFGSQIINDSMDFATYVFDLAAGLDRKNDTRIRLRIGEFLLQAPGRNEHEKRQLLSEAARNLVLAREILRGSELYENRLRDLSSEISPNILTYAVFGRLADRDIQGAATLLNEHRKKKEFLIAIKEGEWGSAYFDLAVESLSAVRSGDAFRYNSAKNTFLRAEGSTDSVMMTYIKEIQGQLPPVPSSLF